MVGTAVFTPAFGYGYVATRTGLGDAGQGTNEMNTIGSGLMATGAMTPPPAGVFIVAAGAILKTLAAIGVGSGCGVDCVKATSIVNQAESVLQQNVDDYENGRIDQATAQSVFEQVWLATRTSCGAIPGGAGQRCVSDRQKGACTWKQSAPAKYPGQPQPGECFDWVTAYSDPLDLPPVNAGAGGMFSSLLPSGLNLTTLLWAAGAGLLIAEVVD